MQNRCQAFGRRWYICGLFCWHGPSGEESIKEAGLHLCLRQDIVFRADLPPTITILARKTPVEEVDVRDAIVIRNAEGKWTEDFGKYESQWKLIKRYIHWQT